VYFLRQLLTADRARFREMRQIPLTVNPEDFMMTAEEEKAIPRLSIEAALEQPETCNFFLGAFTGHPSRLIGIAGLLTHGLRKTRHSGRVTSLFVHPEHRRRGIARMMLERLLSQAAEGGLRSVRLEVVADNRGAIALYEVLGFIPYGREPAAYRLDEREWDLLLMTRDVGPAAKSG
jgi:ribosomal protein S18 acetylase RimI-like enzyme